MRYFLVAACLLISAHLPAQQDYFHAENLVLENKLQEADQVLKHLLQSGAYADRPGFQMMTLNLAGSTRCMLKDTAGGTKYFEDALHYYDSLSAPKKADTWCHREYYKAGYNLAQLRYLQNQFTAANTLLMTIKCPGEYYSATGIDVLLAKEDYYHLRARVFGNLGMGDSAFYFLRQIRESSHTTTRLDSIFDEATNEIHHIKCVTYTGHDVRGNTTRDVLYFISWTDSANFQNSIWFTDPESGPLQIIGQSTYSGVNDYGFPGNCYHMSLSPDEKYLAVECYTEGSNLIEVYSFPEIIAEHRCIEKGSVLAYPANVSIRGWQGSQLCIESEVDLTKLNKKANPGFADMMNEPVMKQFLFDPETGKYSRK